MRFLTVLVVVLVFGCRASGAELPVPWEAKDAKKGCVCGDKCDCPEGQCPGGCPVTKSKNVLIGDTWYKKFPDGRLEYCVECNRGRIVSQPIQTYTMPVQQSYPSVGYGVVGQPIRQAYSFPQQSYYPAFQIGGCPNGRCGK